MPNPDPLIRTKLRLPFIRPNLVARPHLQDRVKEGLRGPLTLIIAPAGFGKTTLAAASLAGCQMQTAWLSLDRSDNQAGRFLRYLIAAIQSVDARAGCDAEQLMSGVQPAAPEAVLTSLINDLDVYAGEMALVLDDYQYINSQAVHAGVEFFLEHCPANLHILIAARSDPPLPLARLRARCQLLELRAADLRFTPEEAALFLNNVMGIGLDPESVALLEQRTEGWIAGLQMAALSMRDRKDLRSFIEGFSGTNRHILDYLLEEILAGQSAETQRFLLRTSILDRLTAPLCAALLSVDDEVGLLGEKDLAGTESPVSRQAVSTLEYLERENLFLVSLDDERTWFRYHKLFADLLRARLQQADHGLVPHLHTTASAWLERNAYIPEAISHLLAIGDYNRAADLIERYGPGLWAQNEPSVIQMADLLPRDLLIAHPKIGLYQAWWLILQGVIEKAFPLLKDLEQQLGNTGRSPDQPWILTLVRLALTFLIPPSAAGQWGLPSESEIMEGIPTNELVMCDAAEILFGMTLARRGEIDRAVEFSINRVQRDRLDRKTLSIHTMVPFLATMYLFQGRIHAAYALCDEYLVSVKEKGLLISTAGNLDVVMGAVLHEWNALDEAEQHLRDGLRSNQPWGNIMTDAFGMATLTYVLMAKGDYAAALQMVEKFEDRLQGQLRPIEFVEEYRTLRVRVQLASGDLKAVSDWADQVAQSEDFKQHPEYYQLMLARILLAQGKFAELELIVRARNPVHEGGNRITWRVENDLLLAAALAGQKQLTDAFKTIESCLALGEPEGYLRVFLQFGEPVQELLTAYLRSGSPRYKKYAQKILAAFPLFSSPSAAVPEQGGLVEPLTGREIEVLQLIAMGKTNPEIARQLVVAPGTVKAHAASIYRKLDTTTRTEAVNRARQLGILP